MASTILEPWKRHKDFHHMATIKLQPLMMY
jgi:hypothetical protein